MRLLKPSWLHHDGNPIFSIDVHPDDTRIVTGGQGNDSVGRVVIWNMEPILSTKEEDLNVPKLLCQLDHHNACVNCVRWSNSGKYLCSGGDDRVIIIWKLASKYNPSQNSSSSEVNGAFGKTNLEQWKTVSMLRSHTGDVLDLAWSPEDNYLASASVDNTVIVWDAMNFPQIVTVIKGHNSLVKGVTWDPVGKYLASQSDDKTLKIWRVSDWELEHCLQDPFVECGGTTHVLRLDWAPDGDFLVSAHAMNGGGPTAQIIERTEWKADKDFVGHRKAIVCAKFNGNILQVDNSKIKHCCVALGSRDRSVSIWLTALKRPLVVIKDLFTNSVMDLSWSSCGTVMVACSWDGSVAAAQFSWDEIGKPLSPEEKAKFYYTTYGKSATSSGNCDIIQNLEVFLAKQNPKQNGGPSKKPKKEENLAPNTTTETIIKTQPEAELQPQLPPPPPQPSIPSAPSLQPPAQPTQPPILPTPPSSQSSQLSQPTSQSPTQTKTQPSQSPSHTPTQAQLPSQPTSQSTLQPPKSLTDKQIETRTTDGRRRITPKFLQLATTSPSTANLSTAKPEVVKIPPPSTLPAISGSSLVLPPPPQRSLGGTSPSKPESNKAHHRLPPMKIESVLNVQVEVNPTCSYSLQVTNHHKRPDGICHQTVCVHSSTSLNGLEWTVCTDAPICGVSGDMHRIIMLCENSTVHVLDIKGRYAFPPMVLSGYPSKSVQSGAFLVVVTVKAIIHVWNIHTKRVVLKSESLLPLLNQTDSEKERALDIARIQVAAGGLPIIVLNTGKTFMYNFDLTSWLLISDPRGLVSSPLTSSSCSSSEQLLSNRMMLFNRDGRLRRKPEPAIITHIKLKLATSTEMKNPESVKQWMIALAKALATHGLKKELHQLCEDLLGPTHSAARLTTKWVPTMIGVIDKRKLLRQILTLLLEDLKYQDFYSEFDELLREVDEQMDTD